VLVTNGFQIPILALGAGPVATLSFQAKDGSVGDTVQVCIDPSSVVFGDVDGRQIACEGPVGCGEIRIDRTCVTQGDCNCDGKVNSGDLVCLITKFFDPTQQGECDCEDCNLSGQINSADATCITLCAFGECVTG
jgi:hypothetical protein